MGKSIININDRFEDVFNGIEGEDEVALWVLSEINYHLYCHTCRRLERVLRKRYPREDAEDFSGGVINGKPIAEVNLESLPWAVRTILVSWSFWPDDHILPVAELYGRYYEGPWVPAVLKSVRVAYGEDIYDQIIGIEFTVCDKDYAEYFGDEACRTGVVPFWEVSHIIEILDVFEKVKNGKPEKDAVSARRRSLADEDDENLPF